MRKLNVVSPRIRNFAIRCLLYADDLVIFTFSSASAMQQIVKVLKLCSKGEVLNEGLKNIKSYGF